MILHCTYFCYNNRNLVKCWIIIRLVKKKMVFCNLTLTLFLYKLKINHSFNYIIYKFKHYKQFIIKCNMSKKILLDVIVVISLLYSVYCIQYTYNL